MSDSQPLFGQTNSGPEGLPLYYYLKGCVSSPKCRCSFRILAHAFDGGTSWNLYKIAHCYHKSSQQQIIHLLTTEDIRYRALLLPPSPSPPSQPAINDYRAQFLFKLRRHDAKIMNSNNKSHYIFMSGVPAIDTRSNNNCIKHKINTKREQKVKQTKKQKHVAVRVGRFFRFMFALFLLYFRTFFRFVFAFFPRSVQQILLTGKSSHKCRSGTRKKAKKQDKCKSKAKCAAFAFHLLLFCFFCFCKKKLFDGWSHMAAIAQHNIR